MIAKELILAMAGYNLVRAVMNAAAEENKLNPRRLSFSRSQDVVNAALPGLAAAATSSNIERCEGTAVSLIGAKSRHPTKAERIPSRCNFPKALLK